MSSSIYNFDDPIWLAKAKAAFQNFDENEDGILDFNEAMNAVRRYKEISKNEEDFKAFFECARRDMETVGIFEGKSGITVDQFITNLKKDGEEQVKMKLAGEVTPFEKKCLAAFKIVDTNGDGFVSREELAVWLKLHLPSVKEKNVDAAFHTIDANRDGKISAQEFSECKKILK